VSATAARRVACATVVACLLLLASPHPLLAWGPGTHVYLGLQLLGSLDLVAPALATLLSAHPLEFLYGSLAADIPQGKRYASQDPHTWEVGFEVFDAAEEDDPLRAAAAGYLSHLAADVVAHGSFLPRMLLLTSSTRALGHSYWEHRMDAAVGADHARLARQLVTGFEHGEIDALLDRVISRTIFSFETNRRIFLGMVRMVDDERWQSVFDTLIENSRWDLRDEEADVYLRRTFESVVELLARWEDARATDRDPTGREALTRAKQIRRQILLQASWEPWEEIEPGASLERAADRYFPLPDIGDGSWKRRGGTPDVARETRRRLENVPAPA
jgi:hypothetical protein